MPRIRFCGHACFRLEHEGTQVLVDPFLTGNPFVGGMPADMKPSNILWVRISYETGKRAVRIARLAGRNC